MSQKLDLAVLDRSFDRAIEVVQSEERIRHADRERIDQAVKQPEAVRGFAVTPSDAPLVRAAWQERLAAIQGYQADKAQLVRMLNSAGVSTLAYGTTTGLNALFREAGMYRLSVNERSAVGVHGELFVQIEREGAFVDSASFLVIPGVAAIAAGYYTYAAFAPINTLTAALGVTAVAALAAAFGVGKMLSRIDEETACFTRLCDRWIKMRERWVLGRMSHAEQLKKFFPAQESVEFAANQIKVQFPTPDAPTAANIEKISRLERQGVRIWIASVPEAITFPGGAYEALNAARTELRLWQIQHDPLVCVQYGRAMAIANQIGDFAIESATLERVLASDALI